MTKLILDDLESLWAELGAPIICARKSINCENEAAVTVVWTACECGERQLNYCLDCYDGYLVVENGVPVRAAIHLNSDGTSGCGRGVYVKRSGPFDDSGSRRLRRTLDGRDRRVL